MYVLTTFLANVTIYSIIHKRTLSELGRRIQSTCGDVKQLAHCVANIVGLP